jgi:hypothetical protein
MCVHGIGNGLQQAVKDAAQDQESQVTDFAAVVTAQYVCI